MGLINIDLKSLAPFLILAGAGAGLFFLWRYFQADAAKQAEDASMSGLPGQNANRALAAALSGGGAAGTAGTTAAGNGYPLSHYILPGKSGMFGGGGIEGF
jgi:hypothetical protein